MKYLSKLSLTLAATFAFACGSDPEDCPAGTTLVGEVCVLTGDAGQNDAGRTDAGSDAGLPPADAGFEGATISAQSLDFGRVVVGDEQSIDVEVANPSAEAVRIRVGTISGAAGADFSVIASTPVGPSGLSLTAGGSVTFSFAFRPSQTGARSAALVFELCDGGCEVTLDLGGEGLLDAITCAPTSLDFGTVNPDACHTESVSCTNESDYDADLSSATIRAGSSAAFSLDPSLSFPLSVAAGGSQLIEVYYCPTEIGTDAGDIDISVLHPSPARGDVAVSLSGSAGGPNLQCAPLAIDFGSTAVGDTRDRNLTCMNTGTATVSIVSVGFGTGSSADFTLTSTGTDVVDPGASTTFGLRYSPSAVGAVTGALEIRSNDRDTPVLSIALSGEGATANGCAIALSAAQLDLGGVFVGTQVETTLVITSTGAADCEVEVAGLGIGTDPSFSFTAPSGPQTVSPGNTLLVRVQFAPTAEQSYTGTLEIETSDLNQPFPIAVPLAGAGLGATYPLAANPGAVDFGSTEVACTNPATQRLRVTNTGPSVDLTATIDPSGAGIFSVEGADSYDFTLATNASIDLNLGFTPSAAGTFTSRIVLSATGISSLSVPLEGVAAANPRNVDTFAGAGVQVVDLLLVVDDSCSMFEEQQSLAQTAALLIAAGDAYGADYRIAVTTTDPGVGGLPVPAGTLRGNPSVITASSPNRVAELEAAINQGTNGSPDEQGLLAAAQAVSDPTLLAGSNANFLRPNAELVVLILSDEPDFSPLPVATYVDQMRNRPVGLPNALRIYTITGGLTGCTGPGGNADIAVRYVEAANSTGGFDRSICDANYTNTINEIAGLTFDPPSRRLTLGSSPAPGSIELFVDGNLVPARTGTVTAWGVDYATGVVQFSLAAVPGPQSVVTVEYDPFCIPATCGDSAIQGTEQCDDGNADETDGCLSTCQLPLCGDGAVLANSSEQCDDFNTIGGDGCSEDCIVEGCGNGFVEVGEECDDGAGNSDTAPNACRTTCVNAGCHDGILDNGEACDDGNEDNTDDCVAECVVAVCGDGFVFVPGEQCDDGNQDDADTCTNSCTLNVPNFTVTTVAASPLVPTAGTAMTFNSQDDGFATVAVGFPFSYLGAAVTNVFPSTNGFIGFVASNTTFNNVSLPSAGAPDGFIAWWWDDLNPGAGLTPAAAMTTALIGTAPNRVRVFTFLNIPRFGSAQGAVLLNAEVRLYETTNVIEVHYGTMSAGTAVTFGASAGWESVDGLWGANVLGCTNLCVTANWPTDTIYRYTP